MKNKYPKTRRARSITASATIAFLRKRNERYSLSDSFISDQCGGRRAPGGRAISIPGLAYEVQPKRAWPTSSSISASRGREIRSRQFRCAGLLGLRHRAGKEFS